MSPMILQFFSMEIYDRSLVIWLGWAYDLSKSLLALMVGMFSLICLTSMGRRKLDSLIGNRKPQDWQFLLFMLVGGYLFILLCLKTGQFVSLQGTADAATFFSVIWNVGKGAFMSSPIYGIACHLEDHFEPIVMLYAPFAWLFGSPLFIMILHSLVIASGVVILWYLSSRFGLPGMLRFLLCIMLLTNYYFQECLATWFYPAPLALPIAFLALLKWEDRRYRPFLVFSILLLGVKEEAGLTLAALGLSCLFISDRRKEGITLFIGSALALLTTIYIMGQFGGHSTYSKWPIFGWGDTPSASLDFILGHPSAPFLQWAWPLDRFSHVLKFIMSTGGLVLAFPPALVGVLFHNIPHQMAVVSGYGFHTLNSHYSGFMLPLLFWGAGHGLANLWTRFRTSRHLIVAVILAVIAGNLWQSSDYIIFNRLSKSRLLAAWHCISDIQPQESVWTQQAFAPALAFRSKIKVFSTFDNPHLKQDFFVADVILLDGAYLNALQPGVVDRLKQLLIRERYTLVCSVEGVYLWRRNLPIVHRDTE